MIAVAAVMVSPLPPYSSGIKRGEKARIGQGRDEFFRIGALAVEPAPIFAGEIRAQHPHRLADWCEVGGFIHDVTSARPWLMAITSRLDDPRTEAHDRAISPHLSSNGLTGKHRCGKPAENDLSRAGSYPHMVFREHGPTPRRCRARAASPVEARGFCRRGLSVQWVVVSTQAIDQRHFRTRAEITDRIRRARRNRMRRR